ncbi:MAG: choice-of-anchor J domain-containing protein [Prevotella sp.]|jgi:hypothetical protein|nr:choice-of-anchor J domain-containing protein [Prevotella sp.]
MKTKIGNILVLFALILLCPGCGDDTESPVAMVVLKADTSFGSAGGSGNIELSEKPEKAIVTVGSEWCSVSINNASVGVTVEKNVYMSGRTALISLSYPGTEDILIPVSQAGGSIVPVFAESWELFDGTASWLSDTSGWSIVKNDVSSLTWEIAEEIPGFWGGAYATNGDYLALIGFDYDDGILPQDQMLVSPAFTVEDNNVFSFDCGYAPVWMYLGDYFYFDDPLFTLKVKISDNNGQTWTELFDAAENNEGKYNEDNIYDYLDPMWEKVTVDLSAYAGKEVKVAFHSIGRVPDYIGVDNISVGVTKESANPPVKSAGQKTGLGKSFSGKKVGVSFTGKGKKLPVKEFF